jgi:transcriptional regulator with XRE-family HTH domain
MKMHDWIDRGLTRRGRNAAAQLSRALGVSADKVSRMRKGERRPTAEELPAIEAFLGESAPIRPAAVDDDADRTSWIERNMLGDREAAQQKTLNFLVYYTSKIAAGLERIALLLEHEQQRSSDADAAPEGKPARSRNKG